MESMLNTLGTVQNKENRPPKRNRRGRQLRLQGKSAVCNLSSAFGSTDPIAAYSEKDTSRSEQRELLEEFLRLLHTCWENSKKPPVTEAELQGLKDAPPSELELDLVLKATTDVDTEDTPFAHEHYSRDYAQLSPLPNSGVFELSDFLNDL